MTNLRSKIAAALGVCIGIAAMAATSFEATPADRDLQTLVTRWAQGEGKKVVWEAEGNAAINDVAALNSDAQLQKAASFPQALARLNALLMDLNTENPDKPVPLVACVFDDTIVIRTVVQPRCGMPL